MKTCANGEHKRIEVTCLDCIDSLRAEVATIHRKYTVLLGEKLEADDRAKAALLQVDAQQKRLEEIGRIAWTCVNQHHRMGEIHELASPLKPVCDCGVEANRSKAPHAINCALKRVDEPRQVAHCRKCKHSTFVMLDECDTCKREGQIQKENGR